MMDDATGKGIDSTRALRAAAIMTIVHFRSLTAFPAKKVCLAVAQRNSFFAPLEITSHRLCRVRCYKLQHCMKMRECLFYAAAFSCS